MTPVVRALAGRARAVRSASRSRWCLQVDRQDLTPVPRLVPGAQRVAADELHRDEGAALVLADLVHLCDVRVAQRRHRLRLADDPLAHRGIGLVGAQDLHRDLAVELGVVGRKHRAHATLGDTLEQGETSDLRGSLVMPEQPQHHLRPHQSRLGITGLRGSRARRAQGIRVGHPPRGERSGSASSTVCASPSHAIETVRYDRGSLPFHPHLGVDDSGG